MDKLAELEKELLADMEENPVEYKETVSNVFEIDSNLRTINIPITVKNIGVESDGDVKRLEFTIPREYGEFDLSQFRIRINYMNANGDKSIYLVEDKKVSGDNITFSWLVGRNVTKYKGQVNFIVCLKLSDEKGEILKELNTTLCRLEVLEGLEVVPVIDEKTTDIIEQLLRMVETETTGAVQKVTEEGNKQVKEVQKAAQEIVADREQIQKNAESVTVLKEDLDNLECKTSNNVFKTSKKMLTNIDGISMEYIYNGTEKLNDEGYKASTEFKLNGNELKMRIISIIKPWHNVYTFVDKNENIIAYKRNDTSNDLNADITVDVPKSAKKLVISHGAPIPKMQIITDYQIVNYEKMPFTKQLLIGEGKHDFYVRDEHNLGEKDFIQSIVYEVSEYDVVFLHLHTSAHYNIYTQIDYDGNVITYKNNDETESDIELEIILSDKCKYLYVSGNADTTLSTVRLYTFKPIIKSDFFMKRIVWFGTSIPAGGKSGLGNKFSYPMLVGSMLGAKIYNEAVGSSPVHCRVKHLENDGNPYGFIDNFEAVSRCLTNTIDMQNWIINAFENKTFPFKNCPNSLSEYDKEFIRNCSYERKLDKYLTEESKPDVWIFDHGCNESFLDENDYNNDNPLDTHTFRGAMNFLINRILEFDPKAKIIFISHYDSKKYPEIVKNQEIIANDWNFPFYKIYKFLGWTDKTISTKGKWIQGFWVNKYDDSFSQTMDFISVWCRDGLHPHTDRTGKALNTIAKHIAKYLSQISL